MSAPSAGFLDPEAALCRGDAPTLEMRPGAVYASGPFERRRRDLTTISAHLVGQRRAFQTAGELLFGDDVPTFV